MTPFWKRLILPIAFLLTISGLAVGNDYYTHGGFPATGSVASSASMRAELDSITAGFDKLPVFAGNANKPVVINSGATGMTVTTGTLALAGNLATTGGFNTTFAQGATTTLTLPLVNGTLATLAGTETFTNKTLTAPSISAAALSGTFSGLPTFSGGVIINSTTNLTGGLDITGSGSAGQIFFPATQNPSANANALDDYEEGTWTPTVAFGGAAVGVTYLTQIGTYTKIGNRVCFEYQMTLTSKGSSSGTAQIGGLPFTVGGSIGTMVGPIYWGNMTTSLATMSGLAGQGSTSFNVNGNASAGTGLLQLSNTDFSNTTTLSGGGCYHV